MILHERIQDLAAAERELLHLRAHHPEGGVILWLPMLGASGHRLVHRRELVSVTTTCCTLHVPVLPNPFVERFEGEDPPVDAVEDELRQL